MSGEILFLAHRMPFPPDRGDKIRSHHILKALAEIAPVHVGTFADTDRDWQYSDELAAVSASHALVARHKPLWLAGAEALLGGKPASLTAFGDARLENYVRETLATRPIETIYVFSGQMGQYVPSGFEGNLVVDLVDVDSAKFESYAGQRSWPASWLNAREARLLSREEERLANNAEHTLLVSEAEAALMKSRLHSHGSARISALSNGIDAEYFDPRDVDPDPALVQSNGPHLVFTGQMDYAPNVAAARRVIDYILPAIRQHYPFAQFHIVGRSPTAELLQFDWKDGVRVWGEVPDVRPFLAAAQVVVVPLEIARGVQNKVLEAMAMACPVVLTSGAATGIDATDGTHFAVEDTDEALSARVHGLLANRGAAQAMGQAAREFVLDRKSWPAMLAGLKSIVGFGHGAKGHLHAA